MKGCCYFVILLILFSLPLSAAERFSGIGWVEPDSIVVSLIQYPDQVERIYKENNDQLIWIDFATLTRFEEQLDVIRRAGISPLFDRRLGYLETYRQRNAWFEYDLLATDTLLMYLSYSEQAKIIGEEWFFEGKKLTSTLPLPSENALQSLLMAIGINGIPELLNSYTPNDSSYHPLMTAYHSLLQNESEQIPLYHQNSLKKPGDKLSDRDSLIKRLMLVNVNTSLVSDAVTWYDGSLVRVIKQFQRMHGLKPDGIIGPNTIKWLNMSVTDRLSMLALNAERIRLWEEVEDTVIVVNIPSFSMKYWYSGEAVFKSKVVVGRTTRQTPLMSTKLDSVILNPTWNIPRKIMMEDILPMAKRDPNYFTRHHIDIIKSWNSNEIMDPATINWASVNPNTFPYRMRQQSGRHNALGLYKFNTPNRRAIYLHDTPSKHLFNNASRAFSSGCIRVQDASLFASKLLETQGINESKLKEEQQVANHPISLKTRIPVHIIYQTVWYEGGSLQYRDDIYRLDTQTRSHG